MKIKNLLLMLSMVLLSACVSTSAFIANSAAKLGDYKKIKNISYNSFNKLDIYIPQNKQTKLLPVVLFFYGGCWGACQNNLLKDDYEFVADTLTKLGYLVVIADYRLYPKVNFKPIISDVSDTTTWVHKNIKSYGGDESQLFLMGHSAGAHLAIMLNVKEQYLSKAVRKNIKGAIGLAGPYDFLPYTDAYMTPLFGKQSLAAYSQPINFINGNEPPMLLMYGNKDEQVMPKNIINFAKKIKTKKGKVQTRYYPNLNHVDLMTGFTRVLTNKTLVNDVDTFIKQQLQK